MTTSKPKIKLPQQEAYAIKNAKRLGLEKYVNLAVRRAEKEWVASNPQYQDLAVLPMNRAYVRNKEGVTKAIFKIAEHMMWAKNMDKSQVAILGDVQKLFPTLSLKPTIWNKTLTGTTLKKVENILKGNMQKPISFSKVKTLAQFRKKILNQHKSSKGVRTFKTSITFSREAVVFGKKSYPLEMEAVNGKVYPRIRVLHRGKRQALRMDVLVSVLKEAEGI